MWSKKDKNRVISGLIGALARSYNFQLNLAKWGDCLSNSQAYVDPDRHYLTFRDL